MSVVRVEMGRRLAHLARKRAPWPTFLPAKRIALMWQSVRDRPTPYSLGPAGKSCGRWARHHAASFLGWAGTALGSPNGGLAYTTHLGVWNGGDDYINDDVFHASSDPAKLVYQIGAGTPKVRKS
jgi:hypothetical protein